MTRSSPGTQIKHETLDVDFKAVSGYAKSQSESCDDQQCDITSTGWVDTVLIHELAKPYLCGSN